MIQPIAQQRFIDNGNRRFYLLITLFSLSVASKLAAQKGAAITGFIKDSVGQKALNYATVSLFKQAQLTQPVKVTYTNDKGKFSFTSIDTGSYMLIISHTGYSEKQKSIVVDKGQNLELNEIYLTVLTGNLQGVTVTASKPLIEQSDDKITFNVENDPTTKTETATDILRKTPFVSVDGDGNVQVNGQSNFRVLLNGRETAMFSQNVKEALKGFPGSLISKIEVITSPSAKYDGEGVGGVINIITKKKVVGYNGSVSTYVSSVGWYNINSNFSAKFGKIGATVNYGGGGSHNVKGRSKTETIPFIPTLFTHRLLQGSRLMNNFWNFGNAELSWQMDTLNTLSFYGNISGGWNRSVLDQSIITQYPTASPSVSYYDLNSRNEYPTKSIGTDYIKKFSSNKEKEFSIRLNGEFGNSNTFLTSEQDNPVGSDDRYIINNSIARNKQYTIQSDFIQPLKMSQKLESGVKLIMRRANSDFESRIKYKPNDEYSINMNNTDYFNYNQDVYSVYSSYNFKIKKVAFRLGARAEHTEILGNFTSSKIAVKQSYTTLLPNVQGTTKLSDAYTLVLNYNMRLQRPFIWNLNPFINNNDSLNISYGNPDLDAQTIHSFSAQNRIMKGSTFIGLTLMTSYSDNMIVQYATFDKATGITRTTNGNLGEEIQVSLNSNITAKLNESWSLSLNGNVRYNQVKNKLLESQKNSGVGGNANMNTSYKIGKKFTASSYAGFWRSPVTIQGRQSLQYWYGLGFGYKFFKEKITASLSAVNFLQEEMDYRFKVKDPLFQTITTSTMPFRGVALSLTWNFGKLTENVSKKKGVTNDDLIGSGQSNN